MSAALAPDPKTDATPKAASPLEAAMGKLNTPGAYRGTSYKDMVAGGQEIVDGAKWLIGKVADLGKAAVGTVSNLAVNGLRFLQDKLRTRQAASREKVADANLSQAAQVAADLQDVSSASYARVAGINAGTAEAVRTVTKQFVANNAEFDPAQGGAEGTREAKAFAKGVQTLRRKGTAMALNAAKVAAIVSVDEEAVTNFEARLTGAGVEPANAAKYVAAMRERTATAGGTALSGISLDGLENTANAQALLEVAGTLNERAARAAQTANAAEMKRISGVLDTIAGLKEVEIAVRKDIATVSVGPDSEHPAFIAGRVSTDAQKAAVQKLNEGDPAGAKVVIDEAAVKLRAIRAFTADKLKPIADGLAGTSYATVSAAVEGTGADATRNDRNPARILVEKIALFRDEALAQFAAGNTAAADVQVSLAAKAVGTLKAMAATTEKAVAATSALKNVKPEEVLRYFGAAAESTAQMLGSLKPGADELARAQAHFDLVSRNIGPVLAVIDRARATATVPGISAAEKPALDALIDAQLGRVEKFLGKAPVDQAKLTAAMKKFQKTFDAAVAEFKKKDVAYEAARAFVEQDL